jgi:hypothetical protein
MKAPMTKTLSRTALAALLLCSAAAQAATFSISGSTDNLGPLPNTNFSGLFSYSGLPIGGEVNLDSFSLSFAGQSYTLASATVTPTAVFDGVTFVGLSYIDDTAATALRPQITFTPGYSALSEAYLGYVDSGGLGGFGSYSISAVPEPATLALWLGGVALLGAVHQRRR